MFTEYALNALLKQTYARTMVDCALFALPLPTPVPIRRVYITTGHRRKLSPWPLAFGWQGRAKVKERNVVTTRGSDTLSTCVFSAGLEEKNGGESALNCHQIA